ncbi:acetyltransferase [Mycena rebaudengoi]|nr:acetyltransferase [Mycena rebaudengoi]
MTPTTSSEQPEFLIELIDSADDIPQFFDCATEAFARQAGDTIWMQVHPGWDTPAGREQNIARLTERLLTTKAAGNTMFLKATLPDPSDGSKRVIAGAAIWVQASMLKEHGEVPTYPHTPKDFEAQYPDSEVERRYTAQTLNSLLKRRGEIIKEKADSDSKAVFTFDLCAVHPAFQRRGIASKLVQWGLDEAKKRGGYEVLIEASPMGRPVYAKLGIHQEGGVIEYEVDEEFVERQKPSNVFMRNGVIRGSESEN